MKHAHYDETTQKLLGWYDNKIHTTIPTLTIEVSDTDWQIAINNNANYVNLALGTLEVKDFRTLEDARKEAKNRVYSGFENDFLNGTFLSTVLNINVDNRRSGSKHDLDNLRGRILKDTYPFTWVGAMIDNATQTAEVTDLATAKALELEMVDNGEARYIKKWSKEQGIVNATTVAVLDLIIW